MDEEVITFGKFSGSGVAIRTLDQDFGSALVCFDLVLRCPDTNEQCCRLFLE